MPILFLPENHPPSRTVPTMNHPLHRIQATAVAAMLIATAVAIPACAVTQQAFPETFRAVVNGAQAYLLGPVQVLAQGEVQMWEASPRGRYILIVHAPPSREPSPLDIDKVPDGPLRLTLWDSQARRTIPVWRAQSAQPDFSVGVSGYFHGTDTAVLAFQTVRVNKDGEPNTQTVLRRFDAPSTTLGAPLESWNCQTFSPGKPVALLESDDRYALWKPTGPPLPLPKLPPGATFAGWFRKGSVAGFEHRQRQPGTRKVTKRWFVAETADGAVRETTALPPADSETATRPTPVALATQIGKIAKDGTQVTVESVWLEAMAGPSTPAKSTADAAPRRTLVATAFTGTPMLLPDASGVLWEHDGHVYGRSIARVPRTAFETLRATLGKREAMSVAKQMGLAILMLAQDNDEVLPTASTIGETLPYIKDQALLDRFQFTYQGPSAQSKIDAPAETILGHVDGPGGKAVVFADGHVQWKDNPAR